MGCGASSQGQVHHPRPAIVPQVGLSHQKMKRGGKKKTRGEEEKEGITSLEQAWKNGNFLFLIKLTFS